jgi:hypothetical protein
MKSNAVVSTRRQFVQQTALAAAALYRCSIKGLLKRGGSSKHANGMWLSSMRRRSENLSPRLAGT